MSTASNESAIEKLASGITSFDIIAKGGLPEREAGSPHRTACRFQLQFAEKKNAGPKKPGVLNQIL